MGIQAWTFWQNPGQITRNFGPNALQQFIGSSRVRQFFGVRDIETAKIVSAMLGTETLRYDDKLAQDAARRNLDRAIASVMNGGDPFQAGRDAARFAHASRHRTEQARHLLMPDEVLNLREQEQVLFVAGLNLRPMLADKLPYFARPEMAGAYLPNPYHPPHDRVRLANGRWARVVTERVPARYAHLPQYQSGEWSYIEGYRPV
jgi:type IV secretion system protein VirD4